MKTREPTWNADFELPIFPHASSLCVALFDHDSITSDDMIGVAHVHLCAFYMYLCMCVCACVGMCLCAYI